MLVGAGADDLAGRQVEHHVQLGAAQLAQALLARAQTGACGRKGDGDALLAALEDRAGEDGVGGGHGGGGWWWAVEEGELC